MSDDTPRPPEVFQRRDGKWDWRLQAANGQIIATSGGQGYEREAEAQRDIERVRKLLRDAK